MSLLSLLVLLVVVGVMMLVIRSIIRVYKHSMQSRFPRTGFPVFSISMLSISLLLLVSGTWVSIQINDGIGTSIASIGGFFGLFESHVRHKREATTSKTVKEPTAE